VLRQSGKKAHLNLPAAQAMRHHLRLPLRHLSQVLLRHLLLVLLRPVLHLLLRAEARCQLFLSLRAPLVVALSQDRLRVFWSAVSLAQLVPLPSLPL
jgi:hypothetical protein